MALAYLTINLDAFTGDDHPPVPSYSTITLDPGADHIDAAADVIHVRTIVVSLDRQGKAATANGVPCVDGKVPVVAGVAYAVSAPNILRGGPYYIPALTAGQVVDLSDYITPGAPLTPDQAAILTARIKALETTPPGGGVTDHGALTGLNEDDHPQYALADGTRGAFAAPLGADDNYVTDAEKAALHGHSNKAALDLVSGTNTGDQVLPTWATISGKPTVVAEGATQAAARTAIGAGTSSFSGAYADLSGKPTTMTPTAHAATHASGGSDPLAVTGLGVGSLADGQMLVRSGSALVGQAVPSGGGGPGNLSLTLVGSYIGPPSTYTAVAATVSVAYAVFAPIIVSVAMSVDQVVFEVSNTGSGRNAKVGLWASDPSTMKPTTVVVDAGAVSTDIAGPKTVTLGSPVALTPGLYWAGVYVSADTSLVCNSGILSVNAAQYVHSCALDAGGASTYPAGALPASPSTVAAGTSTKLPWIRFRRSA
jgi:hypothetical protein